MQESIKHAPDSFQELILFDGVKIYIPAWHYKYLQDSANSIMNFIQENGADAIVGNRIFEKYLSPFVNRRSISTSDNSFDKIEKMCRDWHQLSSLSSAFNLKNSNSWFYFMDKSSSEQSFLRQNVLTLPDKKGLIIGAVPKLYRQLYIPGLVSADEMRDIMHRYREFVFYVAKAILDFMYENNVHISFKVSNGATSFFGTQDNLVIHAFDSDFGQLRKLDEHIFELCKANGFNHIINPFVRSRVGFDIYVFENGKEKGSFSFSELILKAVSRRINDYQSVILTDSDKLVKQIVSDVYSISRLSMRELVDTVLTD